VSAEGGGMTGSPSQQTAEMRERAMIDHNAGLEGTPSITQVLEFVKRE